MKIDHIAIWAEDIERLCAFYSTYFGMKCGGKYENKTKHFTSRFLAFEAEATRIEVMHIPGMESPTQGGNPMTGLAHFAICVGSREAVDALTERLRNDGYTIAGEPRVTGDGYYESVVLDPEGNRVEISA